MHKAREVRLRRIRKMAPLLLAVLQDAIAAFDAGRHEECLDIINLIGRDVVADATFYPAAFKSGADV
ncbi:hypothetical protein [Paracraurococcus lichenis]|uniref:Uncharacterized protein n=1 Tax=Paracraurococcus lichenis TaxID=3064888 RepID=A0ABT9EBK9_9PROT|nr:hypothetical protein [Paracraurococcus sp. LOR1-02]MDO9713587.1 hypothetical protein [Paracraurococcus sp. LOR1-02]